MYIKNPAKTFCIYIECNDGSFAQFVIYDARKLAIGRAFGQCEGEGKRVAFCKTPDEMTRDERFQWGVATDADQRAVQREQDANRTPYHMLDQF